MEEHDDDCDDDDESCKNSRSQKGDTKQVSYLGKLSAPPYKH
jgi:hypothetical protein